MMFVFKCVPFMGTAISTYETIAAAFEGDGKKCLSKLAQTGVGVAMDTAIIMSGGLSSLVTAPLQTAAMESGKIAGKKVIQSLVVREAGKLTTNVAVRGVAEYLAYKASDGSGGNRSGNSWNRVNSSQNQKSRNISRSWGEPRKYKGLDNFHSVN